MNLVQVESDFDSDVEETDEGLLFPDRSPSLIKKINECWKPHEFREVIKKAKNAFKPKEYLALIISRIDSVNDFKARLESQETLLEIREEVELYLEANSFEEKKGRNLFVPKKDHSYINRQKFYDDEEPEALKAGISNFLSERALSIEAELTIKLFEETKRDKAETARRLGISKGALVQRLIKAGAYP